MLRLRTRLARKLLLYCTESAGLCSYSQRIDPVHPCAVRRARRATTFRIAISLCGCGQLYLSRFGFDLVCRSACSVVQVSAQDFLKANHPLSIDRCCDRVMCGGVHPTSAFYSFRDFVHLSSGGSVSFLDRRVPMATSSGLTTCGDVVWVTPSRRSGGR